MDVQAIAHDFVAMSKAGDSGGIGEKYWAEDVVSIESMDGPMARIQGIAAARAKSEWWDANHDVTKLETFGPYVNGDQIAIRWVMDVTMKDSGQTMHMEEVALYTIRDGQIAEEKFFPLTA